jgi:prevent-host-death family protein
MSSDSYTHVIKAGEFKAHCLEIMDKVNHDKEIYVITKRGVPVAKLIPMNASTPNKSPFGYMKNTVVFMDDIIEPLDIKWEAEHGEDTP